MQKTEKELTRDEWFEAKYPELVEFPTLMKLAKESKVKTLEEYYESQPEVDLMELYMYGPTYEMAYITTAAQHREYTKNQRDYTDEEVNYFIDENISFTEMYELTQKAEETGGSIIPPDYVSKRIPLGEEPPKY